MFLHALRNFPKGLLSKILKGNCEEKNIETWVAINDPLPTEFGFTVNPRFRSNEFCVGFLIFDGTLRNNLTRAMSALQSYGAQFNDSQIATLKRIPSEELHVSFYVNENGVPRVMLWINKLTDEVAEEIWSKFCKCDKKKEWETITKELVKDDNRFRYFLEFSTAGYHFGYECRIGNDFGTFIYFESTQ